jgi:hypothetical protein
LGTAGAAGASGALCVAGGLCSRTWTGGVAVDRRTTGLDAVAVADGAAAGAAAATTAAAERDRGVAACRSAAQRPAGGLTADDPAIAAAPAGAMAVDPEEDGTDCAEAAGMRRTTSAEKPAALLPLDAVCAGRVPASPARFPDGPRSVPTADGARCAGPRFAGARFAGVGTRLAGAGAAERSRSTSIGPTDVTSGGRRTRTTSPPSRPTMCPGRAPADSPVRTTRGSPRGGTGGATAGVAGLSS